MVLGTKICRAHIYSRLMAWGRVPFTKSHARLLHLDGSLKAQCRTGAMITTSVPHLAKPQSQGGRWYLRRERKVSSARAAAGPRLPRAADKAAPRKQHIWTKPRAYLRGASRMKRDGKIAGRVKEMMIVCQRIAAAAWCILLASEVTTRAGHAAQAGGGRSDSFLLANSKA